MKGILIIGMMVVLLAATVPAMAMDWSKMAAAETQEVDTTGTPFVAAPSKQLQSAETQEVDTTGAPYVAVPSKQLQPAETQEVNGATR